MTSPDYQDLEQKLDQLIDLCAGLRNENADIRQHAQSLQTNHDELVGRITSTSKRLAALIDRLEVLERDL